MRRLVLGVGAAASLMMVCAWAARSRWRSSTRVKGSLPGGGVSSALNSWLNGPLYRVVSDALELGANDELLDIACGDGTFLAEHASRVRCVAGIDLSDTKVALARRRLAAAIDAGTGEVVKGNAAALPWGADRFTAVTCMDAFPLFADPPAVLREIARVLCAGGRTVVQMGWRVADDTETHRVFGELSWVWSEAEVRRMLLESGLDGMSIRYTPIGGNNRIGNLLGRMAMGTDEIRIVSAYKPLPNRDATEAPPEEAVAVG